MFQNAIINLLKATDDAKTSGTVQINKAQEKILDQVTSNKAPSLSSITVQQNSGELCWNSIDKSDTEHRTPTNNSSSSDESESEGDELPSRSVAVSNKLDNEDFGEKNNTNESSNDNDGGMQDTGTVIINKPQKLWQVS